MKRWKPNAEQRKHYRRNYIAQGDALIKSIRKRRRIRVVLPVFLNDQSPSCTCFACVMVRCARGKEA